jgi:hypothetical protein
MTCVDKLLTWRTALAYIHVRVFRVLRVIFNSMHIGHTYTTYASGISEEVPIRPGLGIYQLSKGCGSEICRVFSENYHITVITALFFGFVGAWGDAVHFRIHFRIHKLVWPSLQLQRARSHVLCAPGEFAVYRHVQRRCSAGPQVCGGRSAILACELQHFFLHGAAASRPVRLRQGAQVCYNQISPVVSLIFALQVAENFAHCDRLLGWNAMDSPTAMERAAALRASL